MADDITDVYIATEAGDSGWQSLSALAAAQVEPELPISSSDGTVTLASPSANTFTVSTGNPSVTRWEMRNDGGLIGSGSGYIQTPTVSGVTDTDASIELGASAKITAGTNFYQLYDSGFHIFQSDGGQSRFTNDGRFLVNTSTPDAGYLSTFLQNKSGETGVVRFVTNNPDGTASLYVNCDPTTSIVGFKTNQQLCVTQVDGSDYAPTLSNSLATVKYVFDNINDLIWTGTQQEYDSLGIYRNQTLYCITD